MYISNLTDFSLILGEKTEWIYGVGGNKLQKGRKKEVFLKTVVITSNEISVQAY